jgi:predicted HAD superfamily hydrolase
LPEGVESYGKIRQGSEFWLRRKNRKEITIDEIYEVIKRTMNLSDDVVKHLKEIEYSVEQKQSFLNTKIVQEIKKHIVDGDTVILISDMYWHEDEIRRWLVKKDAVFEKIRIYISCDYGVTKASGKLFSVVKENEKADLKKWIHTGDNKKSDGMVPRKFGIIGNVINGSIKYEFEQKIGHNDKSMLAVYGVISEARLNSNGAAYDMGASIVAPMVYQYVIWVLDEAAKKKIQKLYFVLRDGYILKIVADKVIEARKLDIKTEFLFGSRVAWRFPELTLEKLHNLSVWEKSNWIFRDPAVAYVPFERLGFDRERLDALLGSDFGKRELRTFREFKEVLEQTLKKEEFVKELEYNIRESGDNLDRYLMTTIDFSSAFALVDTNTIGKTQHELNAFLRKKHKGMQEISFFYHTYLSENPPDRNNQFVFLNAAEEDQRFPEAFFRAPYNPCYGYKKTDNGIEPKFHKSDKCAWNYSFDYDSYLKGIVAFTETMEAYENEKINLDSYVQFLLRVVNFDIISKDEIQQAAKMPFNPDLNGDEILDFYPKIKAGSLLHPFSELIYYPKGSYYNAGGLWILIYKVLYRSVKLKRKNCRKENFK